MPSDNKFEVLLKSLLERPEGLTPKPQAITLYRGGDIRGDREVNFGYEFLAGKYTYQDGSLHTFSQQFFDGLDQYQQILLDFALANAIGLWVAKSRTKDRSRDVLGPFDQWSINISTALAEYPYFLRFFLMALKESFHINNWPKVVLEVNENTTTEQIDLMKNVLGSEIENLNFALDDICPENFDAIFILTRLGKNINWCKFDYKFFHRAFEAEEANNRSFQDLMTILAFLTSDRQNPSSKIKIIFEGIEHNAHRQFVSRIMKTFGLAEVYLQGMGVSFR